MPKIAVIGMSHVNALVGALAVRPDPDIAIFNLRLETPDLPQSSAAQQDLADRIGAVDALCFALKGNLHNVIALINDPQPFFMLPERSQGHFIPQGMMAAHIAAELKGSLTLAQALSALIPARVRVVIDAPPPLGDADRIRDNPGVFAQKIGLGVAPDPLRMQVYDMQSSVYRAHAAALDARFQPSPAASRDGRGMLASPYCNTDPTHGNAAYGQLVLDALRATVGEYA